MVVVSHEVEADVGVDVMVVVDKRREVLVVMVDEVDVDDEYLDDDDVVEVVHALVVDGASCEDACEEVMVEVVVVDALVHACEDDACEVVVVVMVEEHEHEDGEYDVEVDDDVDVVEVENENVVVRVMVVEYRVHELVVEVLVVVAVDT